MANVEFEDNRVAIKNTIDEKCYSWLDDISKEILNQVIRNTRRDSKSTLEAWSREVNMSEKEAVVGNSQINAIYEEFGTGEYAVNKDGRNTPWYVPVKGYMGRKKPTFNGKVTIVKNKEGVEFYKTNGKKPSRAFTKAFETVKPKAEKRAEEIFGGIGK